MKKLSLAELQKKYFAGPMERFDQKYQMFNRPVWDPRIKGILDDWGFSGEVKDKPGFTLKDHALQKAAWAGTQIATFNTSKPNSPPREIGSSEGDRPGQTTATVSATQKKLEIRNADAVTADIKKAAGFFGADVVGVCDFDSLWVYSHTYHAPTPGQGTASGYTTGESKQQEIPPEYKSVIVMGFAEDYEIIKYYPTYLGEAPVSLGYSRMAVTNALLSAFIRNLGYKAIDCSINDVALSIPLAMLAGLGEQGRNGLLISPIYGARLRLSKIITDMPLTADSPIEFGVTEFCETCKKCAEQCPSRSISMENRSVEPINDSNAGGARKWRINAETCRTYWSRVAHGCNSCVASCPYTKPATWPHRAALWLTDHVRWADSFYVWMDDLLGYGKPKTPENFWNE